MRGSGLLPICRLCSPELETPPAPLRRTHPGAREDIPLLVDFFDREFRDGAGFAGFSARAVRDLQRYDWPGNVRQLRDEVQRTAALCPAGERVRRWSPPRWFPRVDCAVQHAHHVGTHAECWDRENLAKELHEARGHVSTVAGKRGMSRSSVYRRLAGFGINPSDYRPAS